MLRTLIESHRENHSPARATAGAVVFHGLVVMAAVWATVRPEFPITQRAADPPIKWLLPPPQPGPLPPPPPLPDPVSLADLEPGLLPPPEHWLPPAGGAGPRDWLAAGESGHVTPHVWPPLDTNYAALDVEEPPELLTARVPVYPELLRQAGVAGRVMVEVVIDTSGRAEPASFRIVRSPHAGFNAAAIDYVRSAVFRPGRVLGRSVRVRVWVPIEFRLTR